jgi:hypothetical protein
MGIHHCILSEAEFVIIDGEGVYLVDRAEGTLTNLADPMDQFVLVARQDSGTGDGNYEILESYRREEDSIVLLNSTPERVAALKECRPSKSPRIDGENLDR